MNEQRRPEGGAPHPLIELTLVRLRDLWREPEALFWVFVFPIVLTLALGIAFRQTAPEPVKVAVVGEGGAPIAAAIRAAEGVEAAEMAPAEAEAALRTGRVALIVSPAPGVEGATGATGKAGVDFRFDPARPETRLARMLVDDALERVAGRTDLVPARDHAVSEPGGRYIDWLVPGLLGMNLMGTSMWSVGFAVVHARTGKLLKRLAATPMRRSHYLLSFMLSRLVFLVPEVLFLLGFAHLAFDVPVSGSYAAVLVVVLLGSFTFSGLGTLIAARPRTMEALNGITNLSQLPMWLLSGTFFSASRFPDAVQPFIQALPLTALNDALRLIINDGAPLTGAVQELAILAAWCAASFIVALRVFRWQ